MGAASNAWRGKVLASSRAAGLLLVICVVGLAVAALVQLRAANDVRNQRGDAHARAFIDKVRACRRGPSRPDWTTCEHRVQDAE
jgi:hypothetical protein